MLAGAGTENIYSVYGGRGVSYSIWRRTNAVKPVEENDLCNQASAAVAEEAYIK